LSAQQEEREGEKRRPLQEKRREGRRKEEKGERRSASEERPAKRGHESFELLEALLELLSQGFATVSSRAKLASALAKLRSCAPDAGSARSEARLALKRSEKGGGLLLELARISAKRERRGLLLERLELALEVISEGGGLLERGEGEERPWELFSGEKRRRRKARSARSALLTGEERRGHERERRRPPHIKASSASREAAIRSAHEKGAFLLLSRSYADQIRRKAMLARGSRFAISQAYQLGAMASPDTLTPHKSIHRLISSANIKNVNVTNCIVRFSDRQTVLIRNQNIRNANVTNCYNSTNVLVSREGISRYRYITIALYYPPKIVSRHRYITILFYAHMPIRPYAYMPICAYHHIVISQYHTMPLCAYAHMPIK